MSEIRLSKELTLPLEVMTETIAVLGIRGSGKTNTIVCATEDLLSKGQQVVVIDPTDVWWGLRSSKDGGEGAYPIVVFGGRHGDVPLSAGDGAVVADAIVDHRLPAILSMRHFESQNEQRRLVTDFARRLYHRKGEEGKSTPLLLVIDEAHIVVPQRVNAAEAPMVGAIQKLVRQGRSSGIGVALIDQRAASVNKDVLTQLELLIAHRTTSPQDRKALEGWIEQHDTDGHAKDFLLSLASLDRGTAWFWSPGWLNLFQKVHVRERRTFDSSATPKAGERVIAPKRLAEIDLAALRAQLIAASAKVRVDEPKASRGRVEPPPPPSPPQIVEVPILTPEDYQEMRAVLGELEAIHAEIIAAIGHVGQKLDEIRARGAAGSLPPEVTPHTPAPTPKEKPKPAARAAVAAPHPNGTNGSRAPRNHWGELIDKAPSNGAAKFGDGERATLIALAQLKGGTTRKRLRVLTGYKRSTIDAYIQRLVQNGYATLDGDVVMATSAGLAAIGNDYKRLPTGSALRKHWLATLPDGESKVLALALDAYPRPIARDDIRKLSGFARSTSDAYIQRLTARQLVDPDVGRGHVTAAAELFS